MGVVNIGSPLEDLVKWFKSHPSQHEQFWINDLPFETWYDYKSLTIFLVTTDGALYSWPVFKGERMNGLSFAVENMVAFAQKYADEAAERKDETVQHGVTLMELFEAESC